VRLSRFFEIATTVVAFAVPGLLAIAPSPSSTAGETELPPFVQSPPAYAARGAATTITAVVPGRPDAVRLVAGVRASRMRRGRDPATWTGRIRPGAKRTVRYSVAATYGGRVVTSEAYHLTYLDAIVDRRARPSRTVATRLLTAELGPRADQLGAETDRQAARVLPSAFAVDDAAQEIDVLDTPNARVVTYSFGGKRLAARAIGTPTATDIVRTPDGTRYVLDPVRDRLLRLSGGTLQAVDRIGVREDGADARLSLVANEVLVRGPRQGLTRRLGGRRSDVIPDTPNVTAGDGSILVAGRRVGLRISVGRPVLDVVDCVVDGRGAMWAIVDVPEGSSARTLLVRADLRRMTATVGDADASVFGDVGRRLAATNEGVVVMSATASALTFTRYTEVSDV
jgi:hypothetical protein